MFTCSLLFNTILNEMDVVGEDKTKKVRRGERTHGQEGKGLEWKGDLCILKSRCTN